ncbi:hypothetical protein C2G38_2147855 [Gigaspora rosea]|uniref:Cytochrome b561 domain-containing protein n=1 Tax=Gigaspora rosea TaxID=44941 RepID=A0A397UCI6_9GLOM|nr:hypothetical protein C2G38_2147855 [Gigaspora rosea]
MSFLAVPLVIIGHRCRTVGWIHHHLFDPARKHIPWWTRLHWWFGRTLAVGSFYQISLDLAQYNVGKPLVTAYYVWIMIIIICYIISLIFFYLWRKRTSEIRQHGSSNILYTGIRKQVDKEQTEELMSSQYAT